LIQYFLTVRYSRRLKNWLEIYVVVVVIEFKLVVQFAFVACKLSREGGEELKQPGIEIDLNGGRVATYVIHVCVQVKPVSDGVKVQKGSIVDSRADYIPSQR
jgi:hypothetical protein